MRGRGANVLVGTSARPVGLSLLNGSDSCFILCDTRCCYELCDTRQIPAGMRALLSLSWNHSHPAFYSDYIVISSSSWAPLLAN